MLSKEYIAGFMDGEGTFTLTKSRSHARHAPRVMVCNTNANIMAQLQYIFSLWHVECKITTMKRQSPKHKPAYLIDIMTQEYVYILCGMLLPYLVIKQEQAKMLMLYIESRRAENYTPGEPTLVQHALFSAVRQLNKQGT